MNYRKHFSTKQTPQSKSIPGRKDMVKNNAGGYVFSVDNWKRLERFLILGSEGGTYYVSEQELTVRNATSVLDCIKEDGKRVVDIVVEISDEGRAPKNDPALFVLAMCSAADDVEVRKYALSALPKVARIGTHLFHFAEYVKGFRGWGRALRNAIANWYTDMPLSKLAYQVVKYQQRDGWSHRDLLRLSHPVAAGARDELFRYVTKGEADLSDEALSIVEGYEKVKTATTATEVQKLIDDFKLTREMVPTQWLNEPIVWSALLPTMPLHAMIRNLSKMTAIGYLSPLSGAAKLIEANLTDEAYIRKSRVHPLAVLIALKVYQQGHGMRGSLSWDPVGSIVDALDEAFYLSFGNVESTGKRIMLALDVSGSMTWGNIAGVPLTPRDASAAMAMITARTEPNYMVTVFSDKIKSMSISPRQRLDDIMWQMGRLPFSSTDCSLPMLYALDKNTEIDAFVIYTDNETWFGDIHPSQALQKYRDKTGIPAKLITVGMTSSGFSIADPNDIGMLDVVGFDTATPQVLAEFIK